MLQLPDAHDDGLITRSVGPWSKDKHHFLERYLHAFTTAMKKKPWSGLFYIDLFCGPGLLQIESRRDFIWGSPIIAAQFAGFNALYLCDKRGDYVDAARARIERFCPEADVRYHVGDANARVQDIVAEIPKRSLSTAFLDPTGLHLHFTTLQILAARRVDLIIFFPDRLDASRNARKVYIHQPRSNLDKVLGPDADWRSILEQVPQGRWEEGLRNLYVERIRTLGYTEFRHERISSPHGPLYLLIFCSHHSAGSRIWENVARTKPDGQQTLKFE